MATQNAKHEAEHTAWYDYTRVMFQMHAGMTVAPLTVLTALAHMNSALGRDGENGYCQSRVLDAWADRYGKPGNHTRKLDDDDLRDVTLTVEHLHENYDDHRFCDMVKLHERYATDAEAAAEAAGEDVAAT